MVTIDMPIEIRIKIPSLATEIASKTAGIKLNTKIIIDIMRTLDIPSD